MAQAKKGQLIWRKSGWYARVRMTVDGERVRRSLSLGTEIKSVATRKLAKLLATVAAEDGTRAAAAAGRPETFADAAGRIVDRRKADGVKDVSNERSRLRNHVFPHIGDMPAGDVGVREVNRVLEELRDKNASQQTLKHVRRCMNLVFDDLWRDELIGENPVKRARTPRGKVDKRERATLEDPELLLYLQWQHPVAHLRGSVLERQTMACVARMFGGLRTGDLHAIRWESFEADGGRFAHGWAPRKKTASPQLLVIPEPLRPILRAWWLRHSRPTVGLVFPAIRGERAGEEKIHVSHAAAMRRDLRRAFGIDVWDFEARKWRTNERDLTSREVELLEGTEYRKPVDFHSWRRAYSQALANANVNAQTAQALAGHASADAHTRYLANTTKARELPAGAIPDLWASPLPSEESPGDCSSMNPAALDADIGIEGRLPMPACWCRKSGSIRSPPSRSRTSWG